MSIYAHRRGSIFWALTLIAVGVLFLYQNFDPAVHPWQIIARYWPVMIIFWGLSKLVDYMHAQAHPEDIAPPLFSASEVILLVLILIMGTLVSKIVLRPWQQWPSALGVNLDDEEFADLFLNSYTYTQTLSQAVGKQPSLLVVDRRGDLEVHGSDQANVEAVIKQAIRAENEQAAKKLADQLKYSLVEEAGHYVFQSNLDSLPEGGRNVRLDIVLRVPKATSTELTAEHGDILVDALEGNQTLTTRHGDAHATNIQGLVRIHKSHGATEISQVKGSVEVDGRGGDVEVGDIAGPVSVSGDFSGHTAFRKIGQTLRYTSSRTDISAQRLSGSLEMETGSLSAQGVDGPFEMTTKEKDISIQDFTHSVKITDTNGDIQLSTQTPPQQPIEVQCQKGEIELKLPANSNFQIDASSRHGEVDSDFSGPELKVQSEGETPSITGDFGKGGPMIRLSTSYGTIRLAREGLGAPPPKPPRSPALPKPPKPAEPGTSKLITRRVEPLHRVPAPVPAFTTSNVFEQN